MRESRWLPLEPARRAPRSLVPWSFSGSHGAPSPKARECEPHRTRTASRKARPAKAFSWTRGLAIAGGQGRDGARGSGKVPSDRPPEYGEQVEPTRPSSVKATSVKVRLFTSQRDGPCASGGLSSATYRYQQPLTSTTRATSRSIFHSAGVRRERDRAPRFWTLGWRV